MSADSRSGEDASPVAEEMDLEEMWNQAKNDINTIKPQTENWKTQSLPLARIKKIMKIEEFAMQELEKERLQQQQQGDRVVDMKNKIKFMISQEGPMLMTKACELFVKELSIRAWQHTGRNRRRTLQRADIHAAVGESEVFDFLIDIVPRVSVAAPQRQPEAAAAATMPGDAAAVMNTTDFGGGTQDHMQQTAANLNFLLQNMQQAQMDGSTDQQQPMGMAQQQSAEQSQHDWSDPPPV